MVAMKLWYLLLLVCLLSCAPYPKDAEDSLKRIHKGTLRVGVSHHPPFVIATDSLPQGSEVELVEAYGAQHHAQIIWIIDSETVLAEKLKHFEIDVMISGLVKSSPLTEGLGTTQPYLTDSSGKHIIAVAPGENALLQDLDTFLKDFSQ